MNKIKIIAIFIIMLLGGLLFISSSISTKNKQINNFKDLVNIQKFTTQNIAKEILYIYKNKNKNRINLNKNINLFLDNINNIDSELIKQTNERFYKKVLDFQKQIENKTPYSNIILDKIVQEIYLSNLNINKVYDKIINEKQKCFLHNISLEKDIQYIIVFLLFSTFIYLIIYILKGQNNFDILISKIETSIKSIDQIEQNVEQYLQNTPGIKDEDIIIESLEELMNSSIRLKQLKSKLKNRSK